MKAAKILQALEPTDKHYKEKVMILAQLISHSDYGHIIDRKLIEWADSVGIKTKSHCEDRTSWWTCSI
jgi:hypothetical protein